MKVRSPDSLILFFSLLLFAQQPAHAAAPLTKVVMTTGAYSEREAAVFVAEELVDDSIVRKLDQERGFKATPAFVRKSATTLVEQIYGARIID
jgi:hypothetical protein